MSIFDNEDEPFWGDEQEDDYFIHPDEFENDDEDDDINYKFND